MPIVAEKFTVLPEEFEMCRGISQIIEAKFSTFSQEKAHFLLQIVVNQLEAAKVLAPYCGEASRGTD